MKKLLIVVSLIFLFSCVINADENYAMQYFVLKTIANRAPCVDGCITVTGDSNVWKQFWSADFGFPICNLGVPGAKVKNIKNQVNLISNDNPIGLFIMIGTNNVRYGWVKEQFLLEYEEMLIEFLDLVDCPIYCISILPEYGPWESYNPTIEDWNESIENLTVQYGIGYIDLYNYYYGHPEYYSDGVHLSLPGFQEHFVPVLTPYMLGL